MAMIYRPANLRLCDLCEEQVPHDIREGVAVCRPCLTKIYGHFMFDWGIKKVLFEEENVVGWLTEQVVVWLNPKSKLLSSSIPLVPIYRSDTNAVRDPDGSSGER